MKFLESAHFPYIEVLLKSNPVLVFKVGNKLIFYLFGTTLVVALVAEISDAMVGPSVQPLKIGAHLAGGMAICILGWYTLKFSRDKN